MDRISINVFIALEDGQKEKIIRVGLYSDLQSMVLIKRIDCYVNIENVKKGDIVAVVPFKPDYLRGLPEYQIVEFVGNLKAQ